MGESPGGVPGGAPLDHRSGRLLIVNADDLGQTPGVNRGIEEAHLEGVVSSATLLANGAAFGEGVELAGRCRRLGVGLHVNLVEGAPIAPVERVGSLVDAQGRFWNKRGLVGRWLTGRIDPRHVRVEFAAQVGRLRESGLEPTHFDSHQHLHVLPGLREELFAGAVELGLRACRWPHESWRGNLWPPQPGGWLRLGLIRLACQRGAGPTAGSGLLRTEEFAGICQTGQLTADWITGWLQRARGATAELMVHPGHVDAKLRESGTRLLHQREGELQAVITPGLRDRVTAAGFRLGHYGDLTAMQVRGAGAGQGGAQ